MMETVVKQRKRRKEKYNFEVGDQVDNWLVKEKIVPEKGPSIYVCECQCQFKSITRKIGSDLGGNYNSKNCAKCRQQSQCFKIEIGQKFGKWVVLKQLESERGQMFLCECDCKYKTRMNIAGYQLLNGKRQNCTKCRGFENKKDLIGQIIGNWEILDFGDYVDGHATYKCRCICVHQTIRYFTWYYLKNCKCKYCLNCKPNTNNHEIKKVGLFRQLKFQTIVNSAKKRKLKFDITIDDCWNQFLIQNGKCALTNLPLFMEDNNFTASVDRWDNNKGYIKENIRWTHKYANKVKLDNSLSELLIWCKKIVDYSINKIILPKIDYKIRPRLINRGFTTDIGDTEWTRINRNARNRNLSLEITREEAWQIFVDQGYRCALSGDPLCFGSQTKCTASLDRIDSTKGYVKGNLQWVYKKLNKIKWDLSNQLFIYLCKLIYHNLNNKLLL